MKMIIQLFFAVVMLNVVSSQFIATSYSYEYVLSTTLQKFQNLLDVHLPKVIEKFPISDFTSGDYTFKAFKMSKTSINVLSSYVNLKTGKIILSPNKVGFTYTFNCTINGETFESELELTIFDTQFTLKYNPETKETTSNVVVNTREKDINVYGIDKYKENVKALLIEKLKSLSLKDNIVKDFRTNLLTYFKNVYHDQIPSYKFKLSSLLQGKELEVDMGSYYGQCEEANDYESALCFFPGNLDTVANLTAYRNQYQEDKDFIVWEKNYKSFLSLEIFKQILAKSKGAKMVLDSNSQTVIDLGLDFTVKKLKEIFNSISADDSSKISIESTLDGITMDKTKGKISLTSSVMAESKELVKFESEISYEYAIKLKTVSFDLCIKSIKEESVKIKTTSVTFKDQKKFDEIYGKIINTAIDKVCITDNGITARDYFRYLTSIKQTDNGIVLIGQKLYGY